MPRFRPQHQTANGPELAERGRQVLSLSKGFTIVEVMMAAVILVVGFISMISALTVGSELLATAQRQTIAAQILQHEMEKLRLKDWADLSDDPNEGSTLYDSDLAALDTAIASSGVSFYLVKSISNSSLSTDQIEVTLTVTWTKSGTTTAAATATGSWLQRLSFSRQAPIARTYTRKLNAWFYKYGLNYTARRS